MEHRLLLLEWLLVNQFLSNNKQEEGRSEMAALFFMGQKLYLIKNDKYRLDIEAFDKEFDKIKTGRTKYNYRFSIKEKISEEALESYPANIVIDSKGSKLGFNLKTSLNFGMYLYVIDKIDVRNVSVEELAYGFIEILPDIAAYPL
jgi:hypothetical protein